MNIEYIGKWKFPKKPKDLPTKGTIFHKSNTPLRSWFFAIYLIHDPTTEFSCRELQRQIGVTYKCAWRMTEKIRAAMSREGMLMKIYSDLRH